MQDFLGVPLDEIEPITEYFPTHQSIDADLALEALLAGFAGRRRGISGSHREHAEAFTDFLTQSFGAFALGGVSYERKATGPDSDRRIVAWRCCARTGRPLMGSSPRSANGWRSSACSAAS